MIENLDKTQKRIFDLIENTSRNAFIQGQAGTGKSYLIDTIRSASTKGVVVACPTAIAAMNVHGVTLHSLFRLAPKDIYDPKEMVNTRNTKNDIVLRAIEVLIIDEISMVRPDLLDTIDLILQDVKRNKKPFGGIQVCLVGDLYQLPPVIKSDVREIFKDKYDHECAYFFDAKSYQKAKFKKFELEKVYRQQDKELLKNLIKMRSKKDLKEVVKYFNDQKDIDKKLFDNAVTITPYRDVADQINNDKLAEIKQKKKTFSAKCSGSFENAKETPAPKELTLKIGAQVIFIKNDTNKEWINGTMGIVKSYTDDTIIVQLIEDTEKIVYVNKEKWHTHKYFHDKISNRITEVETGEFTQFPLQLGYALTIHKAQGKTLSRVIVDFDRGVFAPGQCYVALSRTRNKKDMLLKTNITEKDIKIDKRISEFLGD